MNSLYFGAGIPYGGGHVHASLVCGADRAQLTDVATSGRTPQKVAIRAQLLLWLADHVRPPKSRGGFASVGITSTTGSGGTWRRAWAAS